MIIKTDKFLVKDSKKVVYFIGPYGTPMSKLWYPIRSINRAGYSVVTVELPKIIFRSGDPNNLAIAIDETRTHVKKSVAELKKLGYTDFGFFGSSLGSFVIYNCFKAIPELKWGVLNGGGDVAEAVWYFPVEHKSFVDKGYTLEKLRKVWFDLQYPDLGDLSRMYIILISSYGDKTTTFENATKTRDHILNAGPKYEIVMHKRLNHVGTVTRNLIRAHKFAKKAHAKSMVR